MDGKQPAVLRRLNDVTARHRRQAQVAAHQVQIVARKQRDVSRSQRDALSVLSVNSDANVAFDDVVIDDQVGRRPEHRRAMLGAEARRNAPRREELGVQEHPAGQLRHPQDVG